jgi:UDP-N-acetylglucosamine 2-epimerase (non-hydrolysing)
MIKPLVYSKFLLLTENSNLIVSDSGGLQEEAPSFCKHILITRLTTERPEVIEAGFGFWLVLTATFLKVKFLN